MGSMREKGNICNIFNNRDFKNMGDRKGVWGGRTVRL